MEREIKLKQKLFVVESTGFMYKYSKYQVDNTGEKDKYVSYYEVVPVYVHSINNYYDSKWAFNISPVNPDTIESDGYWRWRREFGLKDIGESIFLKEKDAIKYYNKRFSDEEKMRFKELKELRFIQENSRV